MKFRNLMFIAIMIMAAKIHGQEDRDKTIYQFRVTNLEGEEFDFSTL